MRKNLSDRVAALEEAKSGDFIEVWPLAHFYGEDVPKEKIPIKEWNRRMKLGVGAFYDDDDSEARQ